MKKLFKIIILTVCILLVSVPVFANDTEMITSMRISSYDSSLSDYNYSDEIRVQLNGEYISFADENGEIVEPQIINSRTMVPMRKIFETFGADIEWNGETRSVKATTESLEINLQIGNSKAVLKTADGTEKEIFLDSEPTIVDGRTLVPVRFIAESLEKKVDWDKDNRTVIIIDSDFISEKIKNNAPTLYEYLTTKMKEITSSEIKLDIGGKLYYQDKEDKSNNTSLNISGTADVKTSGNLAGIDFNIVITGKGTLKEQIANEGLSKLNMKFVIDAENMVIYANLPKALVGNLYGDKWIKYSLSEYGIDYLDASNLNSANTQNIEKIESALFPSTLNISSYETANQVMDIVCKLFSDEYFKVSGRTAKTYEYEISMKDILKIFDVSLSDMFSVDDGTGDFKLTFSTKISDMVATESTFGVEAEAETSTERLEAKIETSAKINKYNEKVEIEIPTEVVE